ncbi:head-tail adaptor protein [Massilia sp. RP-1-19]|uniref:Head-tail adaptor protein n=1 Tax=Massilia polaris TaxID=2728846 RepID=A0A848HNX0_9BURK|nr:head-tail adaptor protein [Massilia polaris]NML61829.1 head-tail adaptor protein [Massilia polaris]
MVAPFRRDEKVSIQHNIGGVDPDYGTPVENWVTLLDRYWANVQDELPSRAESTSNGLDLSVRRSRLRMQGAGAVTGKMRAVLHSRGDLIMQIISGPAMLDDRVHYEFRLEAYGG